VGLNIEDYYLISCNRHDEERFSALESILKDAKDVEVQYSFSYLGTIAAKIQDNGIIEALVQKGYMVERQSKLFGPPPGNKSPESGKPYAEKP
jgi:hypothetical protein